MKFLFLTSISVFLLISNLTSQTYNIPSSNFFDFLYYIRKPISDITNTSGQLFFPIIINKKNSNQKILKDENGLFLFIEGTGQCYKANQIGAQLVFTRVDSTLYFGNNFNASIFSWRDTIFSFGGYGFWRTNGQLRYFKNGFEWNITPVNKEYPYREFIQNYLPEKGHFFYIQTPVLDESTSTRSTQYLALDLKMETKENTILGEISKELELQTKNYSYINLPSLEGTLIQSEKGVYLLRFAENTVYKLMNPAIIDDLYHKLPNGPKNTFEINSKIFFSDNLGNSFDSVAISIKDFKKEPYRLYNLAVGKPYNWPILIVFLLLFPAGIFLYIRRRYPYKHADVEVVSEDISLKGFHDLAFTELENSLISQIITKSKSGLPVSVEEVNKVLGLSKKTIEIQKKIRTETINRINHKFKVNFSVETDLIERIRYEEDRRYFKYTISVQNAFLYASNS